ncbi:MAG: hypothetical protein JWQ09_5885 [Segetibacter sp.]|nr:hypothetical protein [Segetibacter sp.]
MESVLEKSPIAMKGKKGFQKRESKAPTERDFGIVIDPTKTYIFEALKKSDALRTQSLSGECQIFDVEEQRIRTIRYIPQADSIFKDEQDESYEDHQVQALYFSRDQLVVNGSDKRGIEYCISHDRYEGNKSPLSKKGAFFKLLDKEQFEKVLDGQLTKEAIAFELVTKTEIEDLRPVARIEFNILETSAIIIRNRLRQMAKTPAKDGKKSGAQLIIDSINNPQVVRRYNLQLAVDKGILVMDTQRAQCIWGDTKVGICNLSNLKSSETQLSELVSFSFNGPEGKEFYEVLKNKISV